MGSKVSEEFKDKEKKPKEEEKIVITPAKLPEKKPEEESSEEESEEEEEKKPEPKKLSKADLKPAVQIKMAIEEEKPTLRRKKKEPIEEEVPVTVEPVVEVQTAPPVVQEEILEAPEEIVEVESAPPAPKAKVSEEFTEKDKKPKEEEKIVITPAKLPAKKGEEEESSEEESSEEEDADWDRKPKKGKVTDVFNERQKKKKPESRKEWLSERKLCERCEKLTLLESYF